SLALFAWQQATDERGKLLETYEVLARIAPSCSVPIYGKATMNLGQGIVGGYLQGPETNGAKVAEIVGEILKGKPPSSIPVQDAPSVLMFDARELKRWGISENRLPPGAVIKFKDTSLWEEYKWTIIGLVVAVIVEGLLIAQLLYGDRRRR